MDALHRTPPSARPIGILVALAFTCMLIGASLYVGAGYLDFEDDSEEETAFKAQHRTQWAIQRTFFAGAVLLLAAGLTAYAKRLDHPMAAAASNIFAIGSASGALTFMLSAKSPVAASYAAHGNVPAWAPLYETISSALWHLWYVGSYLGLMALAIFLLFRQGPRSITAWATLLLAPYGYFIGSIPAFVFVAALPMGIQAIMDRMPPPASTGADTP